MKHFSLFVVIILLLSISSVSAQKLSIRLTDSNKEPVIGATVRLTEQADSTKKLFGVADVEGNVIFVLKSPNTNYRLEATSVGFAPFKTTLNPSSQSEWTFVMQVDKQTLNEVVVTAPKPLMLQEDDKTIVDPEPIASVSTNAMEIMEKIPGLFIDPDGNIYISSTTPATVHINGREQKMSAADIASLLKNLPPNSIAKIEILRTPSAKFDASGSGGVVNVVLKKGVKLGITGSLSAGMNQGRYGNQFVGGTINHNDGNRSAYLTLNYNKRNSYDQLTTDRPFTADSLLSQRSFTTTPSQVFYSGFGMGFTPNKKWEINFDDRLSFNKYQSLADNLNQISSISEGLVITQNTNTLQNNTSAFAFNQDISTKYKIDSLGSEFTIDASYNFSQSNGTQNFSTIFTQPVRPVIGGDGSIDNKRHFFNARTDFRYQFPHKILLETGLKTTLQHFNNQTQYFSEAGGIRRPDNFRTRTFEYDENINSAYLQGSKTINAFVIKMGVRLENTRMDGHQLSPSDTSFRLRRTDLFPYVFLSRRLSKIAGYELRGYLVYRRSITRPVYEYLNPFPRYIDQYLYESGNPSLRPQFTENIEANISVQERPIFAIGRNYTRDIFTNVVYQNPQNPSLAYRTYDNLGKNQETYFRLMGAIPPGGKYFFVVGTQYNHNKYDGFYEGRPLTFQRGSWSFFTFHSLKIDNRTTLTINGFVRLKGQLQFYELSNFGALNINLNRKFFDRKLTVALSANDVFFTSNNQFNIQQGSITAYGKRQSDTRRFGINVLYNFGIRKKEEKNNMMNFETLEKSVN
ncbi:outer membrane beta-barrel protein [Runella sp. MFBS21]|uniref:outer membrane beta-barrel protein n=1 Tax=Runella sp. MFBS21 TaxID=3034018 RepID=UPI0023F9A748|nr:outer membrane beta-barrel protein [Runella sp. MFBS21]MDF7817505.1 outer membrane beta-barrel protein [Runella sp. MFBS21]